MKQPPERAAVCYFSFCRGRCPHRLVPAAADSLPLLRGGKIANGDQGEKKTPPVILRMTAPSSWRGPLRADRVVRPYRMFRIRKTPPDRHHQDRVRRGVRRSQLHSASAEAAKAPYPLAPSSFPNCDRCAGSQFGVIWGGQIRLGTRAVT